MNRKVSYLAIALAVMMLLVSGVTALAAPSPTVPGMTDVDDEFEFEEPDVPGSNFIMDVIQDASQSDDPKVKKVFDKIEKFLEHYADKKGKAKEVFAQKVLDEIAKLLPAGYDLDKINLDELVVMTALNYVPEFGDVKATFEFATEYEEGQPLVALVGAFSDEVLNAEEPEDDEEFKDEAEWHPMKAEVIKDKDGKKKVQITFTEEVLEELGDKPFALGILSGEKEE